MIGDHIRALRGGRWNHGIDCGDRTIIHVDAGAAPGSRVQRSYRPMFEAGAAAVEVVPHRERVYVPKAVVARAFAPIRDPALAAMFADSEAFACWCKAGRLPDGSARRAWTAAQVASAGAAEPAAARSEAGALRPAARKKAGSPRKAVAARRGNSAEKAKPKNVAAARKPAARKAAPRKAAGPKRSGRGAVAKKAIRKSPRRGGR
jgi:hypothetical protein